ncbi:MAG: addiction module antitoxin RelB [Candidatus Dadabacteria bacterium]|nr:MAG: addiction module antitoxin RelB [Candidatus Dadabacteria bacterium]
MSVEELKKAALRLSPEARAYLVRELLASLDDPSEGQVESLWLDEAVRRDDELERGEARARPAETVIAESLARRTEARRK